MVKKLVLLAVLALALPLAAFANSSIDITNAGGTLTGAVGFAPGIRATAWFPTPYPNPAKVAKIASPPPTKSWHVCCTVRRGRGA